MEKLLHERMRECADRCVDEIRVNDVVVRPLWPSELNALADEIERDYIPLEQHEAEIKAERRIGDRPIKWFKRGIENGEDWPPPREAESFREYLCRCFVPLPQYKDGDTITIGSYVDGLNGPVDCISVHIDKDGKPYYELLDDDNHIEGEGPFEKCTPVRDADGERICNGYTVWHVGDSERGTVIAVITDHTWHGYPVKVRWDNGNEGFYESTDLTQREPDSLEKLRQFAVDNAAYADGCSEQDAFLYIAERLTALMERGE